jgi:hypothetical protein
MLRELGCGAALNPSERMQEQRSSPGQPGSTLAKVSVLCGLAGPFTLGLGALLGIALGAAAIVRNRRNGRDPRTEKVAVAGILTSVICLPLSLLVGLQFLARHHS